MFYYKGLKSPGRYNLDLKVFTDFYYANKFVYGFTILWLGYALYSYWQLAQRPAILFDPINYFQAWFMPDFPSPWLYIPLVILSGACCIYGLLKAPSTFMKALLVLALLWINCLRWSYQVNTHVGHLLVFAHLFKVFIPENFVVNKEEIHQRAIAIRWYHLTIWITYSMAGVWKLGGVLYKMVFQPEAMNWLHPMAMKSIASVRYMDLDMKNLAGFYDTFSWVWQVSFLFVLFLQLTSFLAGLKKPLVNWYLVGMISFHIMNSILLKIVFIATPVVLFCLFFPWRKVFVARYSELKILSVKEIFTGKGTNAQYTVMYDESTKECFEGFYAYREKWYRKGNFFSGLCYFPGVDVFINALLKIINRKKQTP